VKKSEVYIYGVSMVVASLMIVFLGGCGNTISGVGKDISQVGDKVTAWQSEKPSDKKETK
jgi:predicted small secreted protein